MWTPRSKGLAHLLTALLVVQASFGQTGFPLYFFPRDRMVRLFVADGMAHRFAAAKVLENRQVKGSVGSVIPVLETDYLGFMLQASIGASVHTQLDLSQSISIISTEFLVDFFLLDARLDEQTILRIGMGHTSHHLGDNAFATLQRVKPLDYSRDYIQLFVVRELAPVRLYSGASYAYNFVVDTPLRKPWWMQVGIDGDLMAIADGFNLYAGCDFKVRQEVNFGSTQRYELGIRWPSEYGRHLRLAWAYQTGYDERGQFFSDRVRWNTIGVTIEP